MKIIQKFTPLIPFEIWEPKYSAKWEDGQEEVWLLKDRVDHARVPDIKITFTRTKAEKYEGLWYVNQKQVKKYPKGWNGRAWCYRVPFNDLEPLEINQRDWRALI
jgi:hypothetical protein